MSTTYALRTTVNATRAHHVLAELNAAAFWRLLTEKINLMEIDEALLHRAMNERFSGGEKRRHETLQMAVRAPKHALIITHYQRLLSYTLPDVVHALFEGRIVKSGDKQLASVLEQQGYRWIEEQVNGSEVVRS